MTANIRNTSERIYFNAKNIFIFKVRQFVTLLIYVLYINILLNNTIKIRNLFAK